MTYDGPEDFRRPLSPADKSSLPPASPHVDEQQQQGSKAAAPILIPTSTRTTSSSSRPDMAAADAAVSIADASLEPSSIYMLISNRKRYAILVAVAVGSILVPFTDTIYLPALQAVGKDLQADEELVAASVAIYMFTVGVASVIWGPLADRYGRNVTYYICCITFLATTLACVFAPSISVLVAFRALQGLAVAAFNTTGQGVVADVFPPQLRGTAMGLFMIPLLVGPLLGPVLGGGLSQAFGWRSTFICLAVFCGVLVVPLLIAVVPETHQYKVIQRLQKSQPAMVKRIAEAEAILAAPPVLHGPWVALKYLIEPEIVPFALVTMITFGTMFASLTEWPGQVAAAPYNLSQAMIGVSYLAMGVAGFVGSPIGGRMSDITAARYPQVAEGRLMFNAAVAAAVMPAGCLVYGWTLHNSTHLVAPLVGHFLIGVASAAWLPGIFGYISSIKQANAAAASAAVQFSMFVIAGALILASVNAVQALGIGLYFTLLAGVQLLFASIACFCIWRRFQLHKRKQQQQQDGAHSALAVEDLDPSTGHEQQKSVAGMEMA